jgi:hypothetical protein
MINPKAATVVHERRTTVAEFERGLFGVLQHLVIDSGRWVLVVDVEASRNRYVQFQCNEEGDLNAEVVSSVNLEADECWTDEQHARLVEAGWQPPCEPERPNYWRTWQDRGSGPHRERGDARAARDVCPR